MVRWKGLELEESSWEGVAVMLGQFSEFCLEGKAVSPEGATDSAVGKSSIKVYERMKKRVVPVQPI